MVNLATALLSDSAFSKAIDQAVNHITAEVRNMTYDAPTWPQFQPTWWVTAEQPIEAVAYMTSRHGLSHLNETAEALRKLPADHRRQLLDNTTSLVGLNSGGGLVEALFRELGIGTSTTYLLDHNNACGTYSKMLFQKLGYTDLNFVNVLDQLSDIPKLPSDTLVTASHALNVRYNVQTEQNKLIAQNACALRRIESQSGSVTQFFSLEPTRGKHKIDDLLEPFRNRRARIFYHQQCTVDYRGTSWMNANRGGKTASWASATH